MHHIILFHVDHVDLGNIGLCLSFVKWLLTTSFWGEDRK